MNLTCVFLDPFRQSILDIYSDQATLEKCLCPDVSLN